MEYKLCIISSLLVVSILKKFCDLYGFKDGDIFRIEPISVGKLKIRKV